MPIVWSNSSCKKGCHDAVISLFLRIIFLRIIFLFVRQQKPNVILFAHVKMIISDPYQKSCSLHWTDGWMDGWTDGWRHDKISFRCHFHLQSLVLQFDNFLKIVREVLFNGFLYG